MPRTDIETRGLKRRRRGLNVIDLNPQSPFETTEDMLADLYVFYKSRRGNLNAIDYRNRTRMIGLMNLLRATFKAVPQLRRDLAEEGVVIRRSNNDL